MRKYDAQERVIRGFEPHCGEPDYASASGAQPEKSSSRVEARPAIRRGGFKKKK